MMTLLNSLNILEKNTILIDQRIDQLDSITCVLLDVFVSKTKQIAAWIAIIGGGIAFFFFSQFAAEAMR